MIPAITDPQRGFDQGNFVSCLIDSKVLQVVWNRAQFTAWAAQTLEKVVRGAVFLDDQNDVLKTLGVGKDRPEGDEYDQTLGHELHINPPFEPKVESSLPTRL
jgi:hypothetical protein